MATLYGHFRTGILSIGAFSLGVAFERNFHAYADDVIGRSKEDISIVSDSGDTVDFYVDTKNTATNSTALIAKHGIPSSSSIRSYPNFIISYDQRHRIANWVLEHLTVESLEMKNYDRKGLDFFEDRTFHTFFRSSNRDYKGSGYDRGHLAAAGNYRAIREHIKQTYVLSNIAPQVGRGFNRDKWNELEKYCRSKVRIFGDAWVVTGPLFLPSRDATTGKMFVHHEVIGVNHVAVPTHYFKAILYQVDKNSKNYNLECYVMPNAEINSTKSITEFRIDPEVIERAAGILLFNGISRKQIKVLK